MNRPASNVFEFGPFRLEVAERLLLREGEAVPLPPKIFDTLVLLVQNHGRLVDKERLISSLWPDTFVEEATVARNVSDLRKALGESAENKYIETVPKSGYRFVAGVSLLPEQTRDLIIQRRSRARVIIEEEAERTSTTRSIAVLPFKELSGQPDDEYLGLGMADALITRLANIGNQVTVRPTSAVAKFAEKCPGPVVAGRELGVESVVDGSIQRAEGNIRVTVQLVSVADESVMWAGKFDEKSTDIFAIEDSISEQVIDSLTVKLTGDERRLLARRYTTNAAAYHEYLKGRFYLSKRTRRGIKRGIEHFQRAIDLDHDYATAYSGLADSCTLLVTWEAMPPEEGFPKAKTAARRALELDESLAEAWASLGHVLLHTWDWADSESSFRQAIELNPSYAPAYQWYAEYLAAMGRFDEAVDAAVRAQQIDPLSLVHNSDVGFMLYYARRYDEAIELLRHTVEMDPEFWISHHLLGQAYTQKGMHDQAVVEIEEAMRLCGTGPLAVLLVGSTYGAAGKRSEALGIIDKLTELAKHRYFSPYRVALIHASLGNVDRAFECLEQAYAGRDARLIWLKVDPVMDKLRSDGRYRELLRRIRLAD